MTLKEARNYVWRQRIISYIIMVLCDVLLILGVLKGLSFLAQVDKSPLTQGFSRKVAEWIFQLYENTQFISWLWSIAPLLNLKSWFTLENLWFLLVLVCNGIGAPILFAANHLSQRVKHTRERAEESVWKKSILEKSGHSEAKQDPLSIQISLESKDKWYKRPWGIVFLGIVVAILARLALLRLGLFP